jgi:hypothetical protein
MRCNVRLREENTLMLGALLVVAALMLLFSGVWFLVASTRSRSETTLVCPGDGKQALVIFEHALDEKWEPGEPVDVARCDRFQDPSKITCGKACLYVAQQRRPEARA